MSGAEISVRYEEVLESLQGCWQNVKEPTEFYMVQQMSVTRFRQKTGEVMEFSRVLRPDSTNSGVQWGLQGRFIMQVDTASTENTLELSRINWLTPLEAHTQALSGPREPGTAGVKGWQWQRVDPALTPFRGFESNVASQQEVTPAPAAAVPVQVPPRKLETSCPSRPAAPPTLSEKDRVLSELQGCWKNYLDGKEYYLVRGVEVLRLKVGVDSKPFRLHWDHASSRLWWGSTGRYSLQPPLESPLQLAVWESSDGSGRGFTWERAQEAEAQQCEQKLKSQQQQQQQFQQQRQLQHQQQQQQFQQQQQQQQQELQQRVLQQQALQRQQAWAQQYQQQCRWHPAQGSMNLHSQMGCNGCQTLASSWPHQQMWYNYPVMAVRYAPY